MIIFMIMIKQAILITFGSYQGSYQIGFLLPHFKRSNQSSATTRMRKQASKLKPIKSIKSSYYTSVNIDKFFFLRPTFLVNFWRDTHRLVALATSQLVGKMDTSQLNNREVCSQPLVNTNKQKNASSTYIYIHMVQLLNLCCCMTIPLLHTLHTQIHSIYPRAPHTF